MEQITETLNPHALRLLRAGDIVNLKRYQAFRKRWKRWNQAHVLLVDALHDYYFVVQFSKAMAARRRLNYMNRFHIGDRVKPIGQDHGLGDRTGTVHGRDRGRVLVKWDGIPITARLTPDKIKHDVVQNT